MADPGLGFFLGGAAQNRVKRQALELQERGLEFQEQQAAYQKITENISQWQEVVAKAKSGFQGTSAEFMQQAAPLISTATEQINQLSAAIGVNPPKLESVLAGVQTPGDKLEQEIAETRAKVDAGVQEGIGETELTRLQTKRDAAIRAGNTKTAQELQKRIDKLGLSVGRTEFDVAAEGPTSRGRTEDLRVNLQDLSGNIEELGIIAEKFSETPLAAGTIGQLLDTSKGVAGQIDQIFKTDIESLVPGDREKIVAARTQARFGVAMMLSTITGEESGRFTEQERRIAEETLRALNASSSPEQVIDAVSTATRIMERAMRRSADELLTAAKIDLTDVNNIEKAHGILMENGLTSEQADEAILGILNRRGIKL